MSQVDGVVDRLRRELREKDEEIAVLRGEDAPHRPSPSLSLPGRASTPSLRVEPSARALRR